MVPLLVCFQLTHHIENFNILPKYPSDLRKNYSTMNDTKFGFMMFISISDLNCDVHTKKENKVYGYELKHRIWQTISYFKTFFTLEYEKFSLHRFKYNDQTTYLSFVIKLFNQSLHQVSSVTT